MFEKTELARLRAQKELLVLQSDVNRLLLAADWQQLRAPENWLHEAGHLVRRHPLWTAVLTAVAGVLAVQTVRKPGSSLGGIALLGKLASTAWSVWKMFRRQKSTE